MGKAKQPKIRELHTFPNAFENFSHLHPQLQNCKDEVVDFRGKWRQEVFGNDNPLVLELACGKGDYTVGLAQMFPEINFIGIDIKGARMWRGAKTALEEGLKNAAFLRTEILHIHHFFSENEVDEIWITFPDPFLKKSRAKKRLTSQRFLDIYRKFLKLGGIIHLKTDSQPLYDFTLEVIEEGAHQLLYHNDDIYAQPLDFNELEIKTYYERMHLENGRTIKYLKFKPA